MKVLADEFEPRLASWVCILITLGVVAYLLFGVSVAAREVLRGRVLYRGAITHLAAPIDGYVEGVFVQSGQRVKAGEKLLLIRHGRHVAENGTGLADIERTLERRAQLTAERSRSQRRLLMFEQDQWDGRERAQAREIEALGRQIALVERLISLQAKATERTRQMIEQGFYSQALGEDKEREAVDLQLRLQELQRSRQTSESLQREASSQRQANAQRLAQLDMETATEQESLAFQQGELAMKNSAVLVAPSDGLVDSLAVRIGDDVKEKQRMVAVRKVDENFRIELDVPSTAAGFLRVGQRVDVKYDAFPYLKYGFGKGEVTFIGTTSVQDSLDETRSGEAVFKAVAQASLPTGLARTGDYQLRDRMGVQVEVVVMERALYQWIFDPLIAARRYLAGD